MGIHLTWDEISPWIKRSELLFIKKLARNDSSWADDPNKHQNGFFVPAEIAESGYFPPLKNTNPEKPHILDAEYPTLWPATGELKTSTLKHYSNKGGEFQHTGIPKEQFKALTPASLLISGKLKQPDSGALHWFMIIDSSSEEAEIIETEFGLQIDFHYGFFKPIPSASQTAAEVLMKDLTEALREGTLNEFIKNHELPTPEKIASAAQDEWLRSAKKSNLDPFDIAAPGDAIMRISRDIEYTLYKQHEFRFRAAQVAQLLTRGSGDAIQNMILGFAELDSIFLSASQTRKSRAGRSFEHHVERVFKDGRIKHQAQVIFGGRRPDFVLPDVVALNAKGDAIIVSLKTTLRERWKQLSLEKKHGAIFLATVDDRVSGEAIDEMQRNDIALVVPESLKKAKETDYDAHANVLSFRQFFDDEVKAKRPSLILPLSS